MEKSVVESGLLLEDPVGREICLVDFWAPARPPSLHMSEKKVRHAMPSIVSSALFIRSLRLLSDPRDVGLRLGRAQPPRSPTVFPIAPTPPFAGRGLRFWALLWILPRFNRDRRPTSRAAPVVGGGGR